MNTRRLLATGEKIAVRHHTLKVRHRASGFTLIEVMIALAIFVIGALAIVRIFPPALNVIQGSESRSIAMNRARAYLARSTAQPGLVPDSIYDFTTDATTGNINWNNYNGSVTGTTTRNNSLPAALDEGAIGASALGRFKRIVGEKHRVLKTNATPPTLFVLSQFAHDAEDTDNNVGVWVEDRVTGVTVNQDGDLDFTDARLRIDGREFNERDYTLPNGGTRTPAGVANNERLAPAEWSGGETIYYVTYRYANDPDGDNVIESGDRVQGVVDEPLILPNPSGGGPTDAVARVLAGRSPLENTIIPGEIGVRVKRRIRSDALVASTTSAAERDSIRGYVAFANDTNAVPGDLQLANDDFIYPTVSLNYTVRDWRWLIDDDAPQANTGEVTTPIRFYDSERLFADELGLETENTTKPVMALLLETDNAGNTNPRFGWWDQNDGVDTSPDTALTAVDRKTGVINYDNPTAVGNAPRARTSYWTLDGWAQQIAVAARTYVPYYDSPSLARPEFEREQWREYYWEGPGNSVLYFPPSEAGKTVLVTFEYEESTDNYKTQTGVVTIQDRFEAGVPAGVFGGLARRAQITERGVAYNNVTAILAVQGLSVQARTAWIENNARYTHAEAIGYRKLD